MALRPSLRGLQTTAGKDPRTPGMLGTGGFQPEHGDSLATLHQRALAQDEEYFGAEHERDRQPGADPRLTFAHQRLEGQNRINHMQRGGMSDWIYAFNEATGGRGRLAALPQPRASVKALYAIANKKRDALSPELRARYDALGLTNG